MNKVTRMIRKGLTKFKNLALMKARFIRQILVASNAIKTIDEIINLPKLHYLLFELHSTRPKFDVQNRPKGH